MPQTLQQQTLERRAAPEAAKAYRTCLRYIHRNGLEIGDKLPPQSELYQELGICQGTLSKAFDWLVQDGVFMRRRRLGTIIRARYPQQQVPPIWSVGLALPGIHWSPTYPRLAHELHCNLVRLHCRDRIYMVSPRAMPTAEVDHRSLEDFTCLAEDVADNRLDAIITSGRLDEESDTPLCHILGWEQAKFGVLFDSAALVRSAGQELIEAGCRNLTLVTTGPPGLENQHLFKAFDEVLDSAGITLFPSRRQSLGEGFSSGTRIAEEILKQPAEKRPDGLIILDDNVAAGLTARLAEMPDYRPALAIQTNKQVPMTFALPATHYAVDLALIARLCAEKLVNWLLNPDAPQTVDWIPPERQTGTNTSEHLKIYNPASDFEPAVVSGRGNMSSR
jgi:hypothetical protein